MDFRIANKEDDLSIRKLIRSISLDGLIRLKYLKEPSFFRSLNIQGVPNRVIVGQINSQIKAIASVNIQKLYINNVEKKVAYISNLRVEKSARNGFSLLRGMQYLSDNIPDTNIDFFYATLIEKNELAKKVFASKRSRMPKLVDCGELITSLIPLKRIKLSNNYSVNDNLEIRKVEFDKEIISFINSRGKEKSMFPILDKKDYKNLLDDSFCYVAYNKNKIAGVAFAVDQKRYKQYVIEDYSWSFNIMKIPLNMYLFIRKYHLIPKKNEEVEIAYIGYPITENNNPSVFQALIKFIRNDLAESKFKFIALILHERDQLIKGIKTFPKIVYKSRLYIFHLKRKINKTDVDVLTNSTLFIDFLRL